SDQLGTLTQCGAWVLFNDPMLTRSSDQALVGNRELKILAQDIKGDANEPLSEIVRCAAREALACESARLQHAADSAVLCNRTSASGDSGPAPAANLPGKDQPGQLRSARDRRVLQ